MTDARARYLSRLPFRRDGVDLVDKNQSGCHPLCVLEQRPDLGFGLAGHSGHDLGRGDAQKPDAGLVGDRVREHGFAAAGGAVEQDAPGGLYAEVVVDFGVGKGVPEENNRGIIKCCRFEDLPETRGKLADKATRWQRKEPGTWLGPASGFSKNSWR